jgi:hypothetical protein
MQIVLHHRALASEKPHHSGQSALLKAWKVLMCKHTHRAGMCPDSSKRSPSCCAVTRVSVCCARNTTHMDKCAHHRHRTTRSQSSLLSACRYSCASFCQWTHRVGMALSCSPLVILEAQSNRPVLRARMSRRVPVCGAGSRSAVAEQKKVYSQHREQTEQGMRLSACSLCVES